MRARRTIEITPFGTTLEIDSNSEELLEQIGIGLGRYPSQPSIGGSLRIVANVDESLQEPSGWPAMAAEIDGDRLIVRCGQSTMVADRSEGRATITLAPAMLEEPDALRLLAEGAFTSTHTHAGRLYAVHSALVVAGERGLMLRGVSGAGKSTLSYCCMRGGMGVVSDDWLYGSVADGPDVLTGYPWRMMMTTAAAERFPELHGAAVVAHPSDDHWKIPIVPPVALQIVQHHVHAVVFIDPAGDLSIEEIDLDQATERFWDSSLPTERETLAADWVKRLLDRPRFVLHRGASPSDAADELQRLAISLR
ncbi:MAG TPA: hypothetical protein VHQ23_09870 [Ilumatobacteraceae bacterium]|jgi:hypothetical protein|nr:hypothetical protein [Ilumatobacteraceae bacterium]